MKNPIIFIFICLVILLTSASSALPIKTLSCSEKEIILKSTFVEDGKFVGGFGQIYKENDEWQFDYQGYLGGIYKNNNKYIILYGNIYNLEQEQIGNITILTAKSFLIGRIYNMEGNRVPIVGFFLTTEENYFMGRIMSIFGPAPHIWGEFIDN
jgi:hypothetical protein